MGGVKGVCGLRKRIFSYLYRIRQRHNDVYWTKWLAKLISQHHARKGVEDVTRKDEYLSMSVHAAIMLLLCLMLPFVATHVVDPIVAEMFGASEAVLSMSVLTTWRSCWERC